MMKFLRNLTGDRVVFYIISIFLTGFYLQKIYFQDLNGFIFKTAGPIFLVLATLAGLSFSFAGVLKPDEDARRTAVFTGEKLFHASVNLLIAALLGLCAILLPIQPFPKFYFWISPEQIVLFLGKLALTTAGFMYLVNAFHDSRIGFEDLFELLSDRKEHRLKIINEQNKNVKIKSLPASDLTMDEPNIDELRIHETITHENSQN